jgi:hypothetical protein
MMSEIEKEQLERIKYWQGQMLRSRDFRANQTVEDQRRWWHNRAEHQAFGLAMGLAPTAVGQGDMITDVLVQPGLAYDCFGRELILQQPRTVPLPAGQFEGSVILLIRYAKVGGGSPNENCWTTMPPSPSDNVEFTWRVKQSLSFTDGVPIAEVFYGGGKKKINLEFFRPPPRPRARPLIATGTTIPGKTAWRVDNSKFRGMVLQVYTEIDTSAAGFTAIPCYFAWLEGPLADPKTGQLSQILLTSVQNEAADKFRFTCWFVVRPSHQVPSVEDAANARRVRVRRALPTSAAAYYEPQVPRPDLYVSWIGCQMPPPLPFVQPAGRTSNRFVLDAIQRRSQLLSEV